MTTGLRKMLFITFVTHRQPEFVTTKGFGKSFRVEA